MVAEQVDHPDQARDPARPLAVTIRSEGPDIVLSIEGEVDIATAPTLRTCLDHSAAESIGSIVLDLSGVTFLDSSGLNAIVRVNNSLAGSERRLRLRNPCSAVRRVLRISGMDGFVEVEGGPGAAA